MKCLPRRSAAAAPALFHGCICFSARESTFDPCAIYSFVPRHGSPPSGASVGRHVQLPSAFQIAQPVRLQSQRSTYCPGNSGSRSGCIWNSLIKSSISSFVMAAPALLRPEPYGRPRVRNCGKFRPRYPGIRLSAISPAFSKRRRVRERTATPASTACSALRSESVSMAVVTLFLFETRIHPCGPPR